MLTISNTNNFPTIYDFFNQNNQLDNDTKLWLKGIEIWLSMQTRSKSTYRSYLKEAERFLLWSLYINQKPFSQLEIKDIQQYSHFLLNVKKLYPSWCGARVKRNSANWKPFVNSLSARSHDTSLTILGALFEWLKADGRVVKNPFKLLLNSKVEKKKQMDVANAFTESEIKKILNHINRRKAKTPEQIKLKIRDQWVFNLMVMTGLRCNEVVTTQFSEITKIDGNHYITVTGKGNKERVVPMNPKLIKLMRAYRSHFGLQADPVDSRYLVFSVRGLTQINNKCLYSSITKTLRNYALRVRDKDFKKRLNKASPHWLRGTFATLVNEKADHSTLQNLMGHSSFDTTLRYIHISNSKTLEAINAIDL